VHGWLDEAGFTVVGEYGDYNGKLIDETTGRAIIWAEKNNRLGPKKEVYG